MRTLNQKEVQAVAGAGILTSTVTTGYNAGVALFGGLASAGKIVATPVVKLGTALFKVLI
jgi:hypothetical protein